MLMIKPLLAMVIMVLASGCATERVMTGKEPSHHTSKGFKNLHLTEQDGEKSLWSVMKMRFSSDWADHEAGADQVPRVPVDMASIENPVSIQATWIGHSTYLIQANGVNILTDPVFSERASPVSWAGPKRYTSPAIPLEALPPIDYVVISHNHYDHLDLPSIKALGNEPLWLVPLKNREVLESVGVTNVVELDWWETHEVGPWKFTATPVQHWSARGLSDRFDCLWAGWVAKTEGFNFYFAGDTGYNEKDFIETGERLGPFDLSLIPIGAYAPRWFMKTMHVNPEEAVNIHQDVQSRFSLAIHWGTFPLTAEEPGAPPLDLGKALEKAGLNQDEFLAVPLGSTTRLSREMSVEPVAEKVAD